MKSRARSGRWPWPVAILVLGGLACSYDPHFPDLAISCSSGDDCPRGYFCKGAGATPGRCCRDQACTVPPAPATDRPDVPPEALPEPPPIVCMPGREMCAGQCVDLANDPKNCQRCGHDCGGGKCNESICQAWKPFPDLGSSGLALVSHADQLYVQVNRAGDRAFFKAPTAGGDLAFLFRSAGPMGSTDRWFVVDDTGIYTGLVSVTRRPLVLATVVPGAPGSSYEGGRFPEELLLAGEFLYARTGPLQNPRAISRVAKGGGTFVELTSASTPPPGMARSFAVHEGRLYYINENEYNLESVPIEGGPPRAYYSYKATGETGVDLAARGDRLYFATRNGVRRAVGATNLVLAYQMADRVIRRLVADDDGAYFLTVGNAPNPSVALVWERLPPASRLTVPIPSALGDAQWIDIATDAQAVYVLGNQEIWKFMK